MAIVLVAVPAAPAGVSVDYDGEYDFSNCKTFEWGQGTPDDDINEKRIRRAVADQLASRDIALAEEGARPDLTVVTHAATSTRTSQRARVGIGLGKRVGWGGISVGTSKPVGAKQVTIGSLVIDILDGESGKLVWQAHATDTVDADAKKMETRINKAVAKAFRKFPPKRKKE